MKLVDPRQRIGVLALAALLWGAVGALAPLQANAATPTPSEPTMEQRVADLEAYVNNAARGANAADAKVTTKIAGPGPGTTRG